MPSIALPIAVSYLVTLLSLLHTSRAQDAGNCPLLTLTDLESDSTDVGLVSMSTGNLVQVLEFNIECLVSGEFRDTYSSAGVVVRYECRDRDGFNCTETSEIVTTQFIFPCVNDTWQSAESRMDLFMGVPISLNNTLRTSCSQCGLLSEGAEEFGINCVLIPAFEVNGIPHPVSEVDRTAVFVFDRDRTGTPLMILSPLEPSATIWMYRNDTFPETRPTFSFLDSFGTTILQGGINVTAMGNLLVIQDPRGVVTFSASNGVDGVQDAEGPFIPIAITVAATGNPFLEVSPTEQVLLPETTEFTVGFRSAFTPDGMVTIPITSNDVTLSVVDLMRNFGEVAFTESQGVLQFTLEGITRANVIVTVTRDGFSASRTVQIAVEGILPVPEFIVPMGVMQFFRCTPTVDTSILFSLGVNPIVGIETSPGAMEVPVTFVGGFYTCSAFGGRVNRNTTVIVVADDISVTFLDQNWQNVLDEHILNLDGTIQNDDIIEIRGEDRGSFACYGTPGHEDLVLSSDVPDLQGVFDEQGVSTGGVDTSFDIQDPEFDVARYDIRYSQIDGGSSVNLVRVIIEVENINVIIVRRFKCRSRESGAVQYLTVTTSDPFLFIPPSTNIPVSAGEDRRIEFFFSSANPFLMFDFIVSQLPDNPFDEPLPEMIGASRSDTQRFDFFTDILTPSRSGNYSLQAFDPEPFIRVTIFFYLNVTSPSILPNTTARTTVNEGETLDLSCVPSNPNVPDAEIQVQWFFDGVEIIEDERFELSPAGLNHRLTSRNNIGLDLAGTYLCAISDNLDINRAANVSVLERCDESYGAGVFWPTSFEGTTVPISCNVIDSRFRSFVNATRTCLSGRMWSDVNFTPCTLSSINMEPFVFLWLNLMIFPSNSSAVLEDIKNDLTEMIGNVDPSSAMLQVAPRPILVMAEMAEGAEDIFTQPVFYSANLILDSTDEADLSPLLVLMNELTVVAGISVFPSTINSGVEGFLPSIECVCMRQEVALPTQEPMRRRRQDSLEPIPFAQVCGGVALSPCECAEVGSETSCNCTAPFLGDGDRCVTDTDRDGFPDAQLTTCPDDSQEAYCMVDTCPEIFNTLQSDNPCLSGFSLECPMETDMEYDLQWGFTEAGTTRIQPCGLCCIGNATRECAVNGEWLDPNVTDCLGVEFVEAQRVFVSIDDTPYNPESAGVLIQNIETLVTSTATNGSSIFPGELLISSMILTGTVDYLLSGVDTGETLLTVEESSPLVELISNLVDDSNQEGIADIMMNNASNTFAQDILGSAEGFSLYLAAALEQVENGNETVNATLVADNIVMNALSVDLDFQFDDIMFPSGIDTTGFESSILDRMGEANIIIPLSVLEQRSRRPSGRVRVGNFLFQNIEDLLPTGTSSSTVGPKPASIIVSSQVEEQRSDVALPDGVTVNLTFIVDLAQIRNTTDSEIQFVCNFFDFNQGVFSDNVTTDFAVNVTNLDGDLAGEGSNTTLVLVGCQSNHLTSFAVLVNVNDEEFDSLALDIVSYIGLGISLICILLTIIFFLSFGKALFTAVHNFVHLNLAIAIFLAYLCFAVGIELAARHTISCRVVTALLHYLFLAVFCWMLSEGVMLYLMLWVVFSRLSKKWWFFLMLGWLPPIVFVVIGLATSHDEYGVTNDNGDLEYCWLAASKGMHAIWAFVAPMLAIMLINVVFLVLVITSLVRSQLKKKKITEDKGKRKDLVNTIVKASVILLPLLGLTWVFGLLIVNRAAVVFAWIFTILNTTQGLFIFFFHVIRHEKIWGRFKKKYNLFQSTSNKSSNSQAVYKKAGTDSTTGGRYGGYGMKEKDSSTLGQSVVAEGSKEDDEIKTSTFTRAQADVGTKEDLEIKERDSVLDSAKEGGAGSQEGLVESGAGGTADPDGENTASVDEVTVDFTRENFMSVKDSHRYEQL